MALAKTFYLLKDAEIRTGELYSLIALNISITQPDLADLFSELAGEEALHARQVEMMRGFFLASADSFLETPEAEQAIAGFVQNLDMVRAYVNQRHGSIQPADLVNLAIDIERGLVEKHRFFSFQLTDLDVKRLFESLNLADESHLRKLENYKPG